VAPQGFPETHEALPAKPRGFQETLGGPLTFLMRF